MIGVQGPCNFKNSGKWEVGCMAEAPPLAVVEKTVMLVLTLLQAIIQPLVHSVVSGISVLK